MSSQSYERLPIEEFGRRLITTGDLDPVYIMLSKMDWLDEGQLRRWLLAYWLCYHCGAASYLSELEGHKFWSELKVAAENVDPSPIGGRWPRASERRYWRGEAALKSVAHLTGLYEKPEDFVGSIQVQADMATGGMPYERLAELVKKHHLFGDWITFKIADMMERVVGMPVDFNQALVFMFKDPRQAALKLFREKQQLPDSAKIKDEEWAIGLVVDHLTQEFSDLKAPPNEDRPIGLQEVETVLCKWKSHMNGHYRPGKDTHEIGLGLEEWSEVSHTAGLLSDILNTNVG
jgi:hypothetical protein